MLHTYRDKRFAEGTFVDVFPYVVIFAIGVNFAVAAYLERDDHGFTFREILIVAMWSGFALAAVPLLYRHYTHRVCGEIRLSDDGICELQTKRRLIRLDASEITSVKYIRDDDSDAERYSVRYRGGKVSVAGRMEGFADFLARLKELNPAVDLTSFPADEWPGLATPGEARPKSTLRPFMWAAGLIFAALLVLQGIETLLNL
jgi:hypothetical protein